MYKVAAQPSQLDPFQLSVPQTATLIHGFDARLANRPSLVFDFRALWRSTRVNEGLVSICSRGQRWKFSSNSKSGYVIFITRRRQRTAFTNKQTNGGNNRTAAIIDR